MALPTSEIKFDSTFIGRIPVLLGSKNYNVWSKHIISTLSAYSVWEFVDGTLTYAVLPAGADLADRQQKWKLLDKHILGLMLHETYSCRSKRNVVVSREVLTKRRYVLGTT